MYRVRGVKVRNEHPAATWDKPHQTFLNSQIIQSNALLCGTMNINDDPLYHFGRTVAHDHGTDRVLLVVQGGGVEMGFGE